MSASAASASVGAPGPVVVEAALPAGVLEANLAALEPANPGLSALIRSTPARADVSFALTDEGVPTCTIGAGAEARQLASRRRPLSEGRTLAAGVDPAQAAVFVVMGFGAGYHVAALHERLGQHGLIVVFEPDIALLRAVLERIDHSAMLRDSGVRLLTDAEDQPAMMAALRGAEGLVGLGVKLVDHPPSVQRLGVSAGVFGRRFVGIVDAVRLTVVTTLVQTRVTFRNLLQNVDHYVATPGVGDLTNACAGMPAIVVSAGPSLARNIELLTDQRVRERFVIVAAQTVLKPLLARGIRPHFVTALDFSQVSARFYEGLTREEIRGVTLVAEAKVNPGVLEAWARLGGAMRVLPDRVLDQLVGEGLKGDLAYLPMGATVAHVAYLLARHLGCEPVALVGQDLGFTDGQYYAAGAAIHDTWAGELNEFNTLEMLEHQRIMRMGSYLRRETDVLGRPIYTDEQMLNYLRGFEEFFREDARRGKATIDATEGGVKKAFTTCSTLREFIDAHVGRAGEDVPASFAPGPRGGAGSARERSRALESRLIEVQRQCTRLSELSTQTATLLSELIEHQQDLARADRVIGKIDALAGDAIGLRPGFGLVQQLGQSMVFNRLRADRLIGIDSGLSPMQRQKRQAERDAENVRSTALVARRLGEMVGGALRLLRTGERECGDISAATVLRDQAGSRDGAVKTEPVARGRVACVIPVDLERSGLGMPRRLDVPITGAPSVLAATLRRVRSVTGVDAVVLVTHDEAACRRLIETELPVAGTPVEIVTVPVERLRARREGVARARAWAGACYRGGIANLTCYDELYEPAVFDAALRHAQAAAGLLVGPDWCAVDPALCAAVIARYHDEPQRNRLVFTQAAPGLCGCVLAADLATDLARPESSRSAGASIGGLMAYRPEAPTVDILGLRMCVAVDPAMRDLGRRVIAESDAGRAAVESLLAGSAGGVVPARLPGEIMIDARPGATERYRAVAAAIASDLATSDETVAITFKLDGPGVAALPELLAPLRGRSTPARVHARVPARALAHRGDWLTLGLDVLSVDVEPDDAEGTARLGALLDERRRAVIAAGGDEFSVAWVVPRLTRCDATYPAVEGFVRESLGRAGWCVIDPLEKAREGERIAPLPLPASAKRRLTRTRLVVRGDGRTLIDPRGVEGGDVGTIPGLGLAEAWRAALAARGEPMP